MSYKIVRCESAGCFAGDLESLDDAKAVAILSNARRLWYWEGAASLSQLAATGTSEPASCKFCAPVRLKVFGVIEVIDVTEDAKQSIMEVPVWTE